MVKLLNLVMNRLKQDKNIAERHGIKLSNHSLYLYGHCSKKDHCDENDLGHPARNSKEEK